MNESLLWRNLSRSVNGVDVPFCPLLVSPFCKPSRPFHGVTHALRPSKPHLTVYLRHFLARSQFHHHRLTQATTSPMPPLPQPLSPFTKSSLKSRSAPHGGRVLRPLAWSLQASLCPIPANGGLRHLPLWCQQLPRGRKSIRLPFRRVQRTAGAPRSAWMPWRCRQEVGG